MTMAKDKSGNFIAVLPDTPPVGMVRVHPGAGKGVLQKRRGDAVPPVLFVNLCRKVPDVHKIAQDSEMLGADVFHDNFSFWMVQRAFSRMI